ncbi:MAG: response regulator [Vicinamibacteria bacterium]|nr:response regulator [Vicinamibacteria bacterium]
MSDETPLVLVVDDDASFVRLLTELLREMGYEVISSQDGMAALELVRDSGPLAAAIVDLVMPGMSGTALAGRLKSVDADLPVLILTGHADFQSAVEGIHRGVFDYLRKDTLDYETLQQSLRQAVERSRLSRDNRMLVGRLSGSNALLEALFAISAELSRDPDAERILARLVVSAKDLCRAEAARALLFKSTHRGGWIVETAVGDGAKILVGARLDPGQGVAALAAEEFETIRLENPQSHPRYLERCDQMPSVDPGFICSPLRQGLIFGALTIAGSEQGTFSDETRTLVGRLAAHGAIAADNAVRQSRAINFFTHTCDILVGLLDSLDVMYSGHSRRVAVFSDMISRRMGLDDATRRNVHFAALLHDIGKMRLGPAILNVEGQFSDDQRRIMKDHPAFGVEVLRPIVLWEDILPMIHCHHERWDGGGYPQGMAQDEIPLGARIVAVAEVFEAITRLAPHLPGLSTDQALDELARNAGSQFDPLIVRLFTIEFLKQQDLLPK